MGIFDILLTIAMVFINVNNVAVKKLYLCNNCGCAFVLPGVQKLLYLQGVYGRV